ncbi:MAG: right-handed parallel beta-helix repeat-containing protein, partial [Candidatus Thalassarchaeaceae archaeon]
MPAHPNSGFKRAVFLVSILLMSSIAFAPMTSLASNSKSTTVWNGTINLVDGYTVESGEILVVEAGTEINLGDDKDILIAGRITVEGTSSSPVILNSIMGNHDGLIFNSSSNGLGSKIDNLTIRNSEYGITIYGSNPTINNLRVENADLVAVDLFDSASPRINNLVIEGGGQDIPLNTNWRKGIGLSVGASSSPIVNGAVINDLVTRGLNYWGNSGGVISNLHVSNISGATTSIAAGIWVEDSLPLIVDSSVSRSDNGIYVRHITQGWNTRPTFTNVVIEDSQYRGVMVEQYNHSQFSNLPINSIFTNLVIRGTGGVDAKTPGLGIAALEVNTSGIRIEGALIENNPVVGFRAYMIDSSMVVNNLTMINNGETGFSVPFNDRAGLFWRSSNWGTSGPPTLNNLVVRNSTGPGVLLWKGGVRGTNWNVSDNGASGVDFREFHPDVNAVQSFNNSGHGVSVRDSSNVELEYIVTSGNGINSLSSSFGSGFYFEESNDVVSGGKNVSCYMCSSFNDKWGVTVKDSIDLQLINLTILNSTQFPSLDIDNEGVSHQGKVILNNVSIEQTCSPVDGSDHCNTDETIVLKNVDAEINSLYLFTEGCGFYWSAKGDLISYINDSYISQDPECMVGSTFAWQLEDHTQLEGINLDLTNAPVSLTNSVVNISNSMAPTYWSQSSDDIQFQFESTSHLRWISPSIISDEILNTEFGTSDSILDIMWNVEVHVLNQYLNHIP